MTIQEIIETYGKNDYYDMNTGKIYKLSEMKYFKEDDITEIPVDKAGILEFVSVKGDLTK